MLCLKQVLYVRGLWPRLRRNRWQGVRLHVRWRGCLSESRLQGVVGCKARCTVFRVPPEVWFRVVEVRFNTHTTVVMSKHGGSGPFLLLGKPPW
jgi:hypothetical protein